MKKKSGYINIISNENFMFSYFNFFHSNYMIVIKSFYENGMTEKIKIK